jgi:hypothetical protein
LDSKRLEIQTRWQPAERKKTESPKWQRGKKLPEFFLGFALVQYNNDRNYLIGKEVPTEPPPNDHHR